MVVVVVVVVAVAVAVVSLLPVVVLRLCVGMDAVKGFLDQNDCVECRLMIGSRRKA